MKENYCINCKHHKYYARDNYCLNPRTGVLVKSPVDGSIETKRSMECRYVRPDKCKGDWYNPKSFTDKLICLFS